MILNQDQALEIAKKSLKHREDVEEARKLEQRIRLHTVGDEACEDSVKYFTEWASKQVSTEKYKEFMDVMLYPLPTVGVTDNIFDDLSKLFEAENANYTAIRFKKDADTTAQDFEATHKFKDMMKDRVFRTFISRPNSFFVVEPIPGADPELYFVNINQYIAHEYGNNRKMEYLAWSKDSALRNLVVLDEQQFHFFSKATGESEYTYSVKPHGLGEVPADLIYKDFFSDEDELKVKSPLAKKVGDLDWLLFWKLAKKVLDKSAPFPIYSHYRFPCNFEDPVSHASCEGGTLRWADEEGKEVVKECPRCKSSLSQRMIAGSRVEIPAPESKEDVDLRDPVQVLDASEISINYVTKEEERLENAIFYSIVGKSLVPLEAFSASETQIDVATESKKNVFLKMSKILQNTHNKIVNAFGKYLYADKFLGAEIEYGDNWFLKTPEADAEFYKTLTDAGVSQQIRINQLRQVVKNMYSTDTDERTKQLLLIDLEPFVLHSIEDVGTMYQAKLVTAKTLAQKIYFNDIVYMVEEKVGHIGAFLNAYGGPYGRKREKLVELMNQKLEEFVKLIPPPTPPETGQASGGKPVKKTTK